MCMIDKEWPKVKEESELLVKQIQEASKALINIDDAGLRQEMVGVFTQISQILTNDSKKLYIKFVLEDVSSKLNFPSLRQAL